MTPNQKTGAVTLVIIALATTSAMASIDLVSWRDHSIQQDATINKLVSDNNKLTNKITELQSADPHASLKRDSAVYNLSTNTSGCGIKVIDTWVYYYFCENGAYFVKLDDGKFTFTPAPIYSNCVLTGTVWGACHSGGYPNDFKLTVSSIPAYQNIIDEAIQQHKGACFYFFKELSGHTTFTYSLENNCDGGWKSIEVNP